MPYDAAKLTLANGALYKLGASGLTTLTEASDKGYLVNANLDLARKTILRQYPWGVALHRKRLNSYPAGTLTPGATTGTGITFTSSAGVFTADDVDYRVIGGASTIGQGIIASYVDPNTVTVDITTDFASVAAIANGSWRIMPNWEFAHRYAKPSDFLRLYQVNDPGNPSSAGILWTMWEETAPPFKLENTYLVSDIGPYAEIAYIRDIEDPAAWDDLLYDAIQNWLAFRICYGVTGSLAAMKTMFEATQAALALARTIDSQEGSSDVVWDDTLVNVRRS